MGGRLRRGTLTATNCDSAARSFSFLFLAGVAASKERLDRSCMKKTKNKQKKKQNKMRITKRTVVVFRGTET